MPKAGPPRGDLLELVRTASPSRTKETDNPQQEEPNMQGKSTQDSEVMENNSEINSIHI